MGASAWLLWLKVNGLLELRATACPFQWSYLIAAVIVGALGGMLAQLLWGASGAYAARRLGGEGSAGRLRIAWAAASIPHAGALLVLLPLDLVLVGSDAYRAVASDGAGATAWRALSVAFAISLLVWSLWILYRGTEAATGLRPRPAAGLVFTAAVCLLLPIAPLIIAGSGGVPCPT